MSTSCEVDVCAACKLCIYINIYIHTCVCVCVFVFVCLSCVLRDALYRSLIWYVSICFHPCLQAAARRVSAPVLGPEKINSFFSVPHPLLYEV